MVKICTGASAMHKFGKGTFQCDEEVMSWCIVLSLPTVLMSCMTKEYG